MSYQRQELLTRREHLSSPEVLYSIVCLCTYYRSRSDYLEWDGKNHRSGLTSPPFCACPKPGTGFPSTYVVLFYVFSVLRCEIIVLFVDIGGIVDN